MPDENMEAIAGKVGTLFLRSWQADQPRAVIVICHGFNAHSGMYQWVGQEMCEKRLSVYAVDLRGRGRSEGARFYAETFEDYVDDLKKAVEVAKERNPGRPIFLLGHSAGGVVSCMYALKYGSEIHGLICESFALRLPAPGFALAAIKLLARVLPRFRAVTLNNTQFSRDPDVVTSMNADPLIVGEGQPAATVAALLNANRKLDRFAAAIRLPLMILHGSDDKVTAPAGSEMFYEKAGSTDKVYRVYKGHVHDLLNDVGKEDVLRDILVWIEAHASPGLRLAVDDVLIPGMSL